jgi:hypothetical protein
MRSTHQSARRGYVRQPVMRQKAAMFDAYANEIRLGDQVTPAELPGPRQLPNWTYGLTGVVVSLGRVRVGVRFSGVARIELLPPRPLLVVHAVDSRLLTGPTAT